MRDGVSGGLRRVGGGEHHALRCGGKKQTRDARVEDRERGRRRPSRRSNRTGRGIPDGIADDKRDRTLLCALRGAASRYGRGARAQRRLLRNAQRESVVATTIATSAAAGAVAPCAIGRGERATAYRLLDQPVGDIATASVTSV